MNKPTPNAVRVEVERLKQHCRDTGTPIFPGDMIIHKALPVFIPRSEGTLYNWRNVPTPPIPCVKIGGRLMYRLEDIARWRLENFVA